MRRLAAVRGWSVLVSLAIHGTLLGGATYAALKSLHRADVVLPNEPAPRGVDEIELPVVLADEQSNAAPMPVPVASAPTPPPLAGAARRATVDQNTLGKSGAPARDPAVNLSPRAEPFTFVPDPLSDLRRMQDQHVHSAEDRAAFEDRRSAREPMDLTFVATGAGQDAARRAQGKTAAPGTSQFLHASMRGARALGQDLEPEQGTSNLVGGPRMGSAADVLGAGTPTGRSADEHREAQSMKVRPSVTEASPSIPAEARGLVRDNTDSDQAVATALRSIVRASTAGGASGESVGGSGTSGEAGSGGASGEGSRTRVSGPGGVDWFDFDSRDPSLLPYFRQLHGRIDPLTQNAFPREAMVELKQGYVILEFTVRRDGGVRVSWPPVRPSGIPEYDQNCAEAVRKAAPFPPPPAALGRSEVKVRATFRATRQW